MNFSESVKKVMEEKGLSPSDLARLIDYTPQYVIDLLRNSRRWNETTITKTCEALELEIRISKKKNKRIMQ